jgi:hypothetical protein
VTPEGGFASLDTWARACDDPEAELIMLLDEATFLQVHGGVAINNPAAPHALFQEDGIKILSTRSTGFQERAIFLARPVPVLKASLTARP